MAYAHYVAHNAVPHHYHFNVIHTTEMNDIQYDVLVTGILRKVLVNSYK